MERLDRNLQQPRPEQAGEAQGPSIEDIRRTLDRLDAERVVNKLSEPAAEALLTLPETEEQTAESDPERELYIEGVRESFTNLEQALEQVPEADESFRTDVTQRARNAVKKHRGRAWLQGLVASAVLLITPATLYVKDALQEHAQSRYAVEQVVDSRGETHFTHADPQTNEILDYLGGKGKLRPETKLSLIKEGIRNLAYQWHLPTPGALDSMDAGEVRLAAEELFRARYAGQQNVSIAGSVDNFYDEAIPDASANPELYEKLWELEEKVGSPRIRWTFQASSEQSSVVGSFRPFYDPRTNTVYISNVDAYSTLVSEQAHSLQYQLKPVTTRLRMEFEIIQRKWRASTQHVSLYDAQFSEYHSAGTVESEAHGTIERSLRDQLPELPPRG